MSYKPLVYISGDDLPNTYWDMGEDEQLTFLIDYVSDDIDDLPISQVKPWGGGDSTYQINRNGEKYILANRFGLGYASLTQIV